MKSRYNISSLNLSFHTPDEIKKLSAADISNPLSFDTFGHPLSHGLYDPRLGPINERSGPCKTCNLTYHDCPGHFGHIKLPTLVYHPLTFDALLLLINSVCHSCYFFKLSQDERLCEYAKLTLVSKGHSVSYFYQEMEKFDSSFKNTKMEIEHDLLVQENEPDQEKIIINKSKKMSLYDKIEDLINNIIPQTFNPNDHHKEVTTFLKFCASFKKCMNCFQKAQAVKKDKILLVANGEVQDIYAIKRIIENAYLNETEILNLCFKNFNPDMFFMDSVIVTPTRFRPMSFVNGKQFESALNEVLSKIIRASSIKSKTLMKKGTEKNKKGKKTSAEDESDKITVTSDAMSRDEKTTNMSKLSKDEIDDFVNEDDIVKKRKKDATLMSQSTKDDDEIMSQFENETNIEDPIVNLTDECVDKATNNFMCGSKEFAELQNSIYLYFDSSSAPGNTRVIGVKQVLEKKEGLFRKHLMGKRVNHAARSVISPDPHLHTREIGIPAIFAETLVFPEKVTPFNVERLRKSIINGTKYPGANYLGTTANHYKVKFDLSKLNEQKRTELANRSLTTDSIVYRHMQNNDIVLVNRQPTLHKPSIMAHRVRVLPGEKTIRMHYANCNSYNADFDGDEMNIHYLQDHLARAEGYLLMGNDFNYLVSTDGSPVRGLVQDHIVVMARICLKDEFFVKEEFLQYIIECKTHNKKENTKNELEDFLKYEKVTTASYYVPKPTIMRPVTLYTGKQVTTAILKSMSLDLDHTNKSKHSQIEDGEVIIRNGHLLKGIIDKNQLGPTKNGLIHACGEKYGYSICNELLTSFGRVLNKIMIRQGFCARIDEFMLEEEGNYWRSRFCRESEIDGTKACKVEILQEVDNDNAGESAKIRSTLHGEGQNSTGEMQISCAINTATKLKDDYFFIDQNVLSYLDACVKSEMNKLTTKIIDLAITKHQFIKYPFNNFSLMVLSGAKGSMVNIGQISGLLGQQELEGKRVPLMISGTSLPCYKSYSLEPQAGGYIFGRFLDGINPSEYFFHCMAGREGLIDTAVKTARSGYLQRCLIKGLEGCKIEYDMSVRCDGDVIQFMYGEDGKPKPDSTKKRDRYYTISDEYASSFFDPSVSYMLSPGEAVGIIAAQSVGEPSTQMTLNTFHLAGVGSKNVTLGIPRLVEILMVAGKTIKTPVIRVSVNEEIAMRVINKTKRKTLKDVINSIKIEENGTQIKIALYSKIDLNKKGIENKIVKMIDKAVRKKNKSNRIDFNETKETIEESEQNEKDQNESDDESVSEEKIELKDSDDDQEIPKEEEEESNTSSSNVSVDNINKIETEETNVIRLEFDLSNNNILLLPILESIFPRIIVQEWSGIKNSTYSENTLILEGSDLYSLINLVSNEVICKTYTNDIYAVLQTLGVEAARYIIVNEITSVFDVYGIKIDVRHLMLIADYMTKDGTYKPFNRHSMKYGRSFLQKMCFESCFTYLKEGVLFGEKDYVNNPSSELCVGKNVSIGSNANFELKYAFEEE